MDAHVVSVNHEIDEVVGSCSGRVIWLICLWFYDIGGDVILVNHQRFQPWP